MNFSEFIGFIVTMAAMVYFAYRQSRESEQAPEDDEQLREEKSNVKDILRSLNIELKDEVAAPRLPPRPAVRTAMTPASQPRKLPITPKKAMRVEEHFNAGDSTSVDLRFEDEMLALPSLIPLEYGLPAAPSRVKVIANHLTSREDLLIIHDLFGPPKGL